MTTEIIFQTIDKQEEEILNLDLSLIKMKIMDSEDGLGWTYEQCEEAEIEYKRFLLLIYRNSKIGIVPTKIMDSFWHYHILDTRKYYTDCTRIFGNIIHHFPYFGMRGEQDKQNLIDSFNRTKNIYLATFGSLMDKQFSYCDSGGGNCVSNCNAGDIK